VLQPAPQPNCYVFLKKKKKGKKRRKGGSNKGLAIQAVQLLKFLHAFLKV